MKYYIGPVLLYGSESWNVTVIDSGKPVQHLTEAVRLGHLLKVSLIPTVTATVYGINLTRQCSPGPELVWGL